MTNITINSLPTYSGTSDHVNDIIPIYDYSTASTTGISVNNLITLSSQAVGLTDSQTLTNKTLTTPAISAPVLSGTVTGTYTLGGTPTFPATIVTTTGSQTLTNKTLTSPTINSATISNPTLSVDTITGYSVATNVTVGNVTLNNGAVGATTVTTSGLVTAGNGLTVSAGSVSLPNNAIQAAAFATNAITLGYAQITSNFGVSTTTPTQVTSLTTTVTIPAGSRKIKITVFAQAISNGAVAQQTLEIWDGVVNSGTKLAGTDMVSSVAQALTPAMVFAVVTPAAGSKTYNVGIHTTTGTATLTASATNPAFILVEAI